MTSRVQMEAVIKLQDEGWESIQAEENNEIMGGYVYMKNSSGDELYVDSAGIVTKIDSQKLEKEKLLMNLIIASRAGKELTELCHGLSKASGWWNDPETGEPLEPNIGEKLCLIHSEISEAMEGARKNLDDDHLPHRKMIEVELADAVIRIFDLAGGLGLDVGGAIEEKLKYNSRREDHKPENRVKDGGKKF